MNAVTLLAGQKTVVAGIFVVLQSTSFFPGSHHARFMFIPSTKGARTWLTAGQALACPTTLM